MPILDRALIYMDDRKKLYTDYTLKINHIEECINDEMSKYDLREFDLEYGFEREIEPEFYPIPLKEFLADAKKELRELIRQRNFVYGYGDGVEEDYYDHE